MSLTENSIVGKSKDEPLMVFIFVCYVSKLCLSLIKPSCFEEINKKCLNYVETQWALGQEGFIFVSYWLQTQRTMYPSDLQSSLGISQRVTNTLQVLLKWSSRAFSRISQRRTAQIWAFPSHFPRSSMFMFSKVKNWRHNRKL